MHTQLDARAAFGIYFAVVIALMSAEGGQAQAFHSRGIEGMFQDLEISRVLSQRFEATAQAKQLLDEACRKCMATTQGNHKSLSGSARFVGDGCLSHHTQETRIEFVASVLTAGRWPAQPSADISIPSIPLRLMRRGCETVPDCASTQHYVTMSQLAVDDRQHSQIVHGSLVSKDMLCKLFISSSTTGRSLSWCPAWGQCVLRATYGTAGGQTRKEFVVSHFQALVSSLLQLSRLSKLWRHRGSYTNSTG